MRTSYPFALALALFGALHCGGTQLGSTADSGPKSDAGSGSDGSQPGPPPDGLPPPANHRPSPVACSSTRPPGLNTDAGPGFDAGVDTPCTHDSECTAGKNGRCTPSEHNGFATCEYDQCASDQDCPKSEVCECGQAANTGRYPNVCLPGNCRVDADCGSGGYCSPSFGTMCGSYGGIVGYFCHTAKDECTNDDECTDGPGYCALQPTTGAWTCFYSVCAG
jgi:hypothetical protein